MAHMQAAWPEQTLCKENKRKAILEQQRKWMEQRERAGSTSQPTEAAEADKEDGLDGLEELGDINSFLASVSQSLAADSPTAGDAERGEHTTTPSPIPGSHAARTSPR